MVVQTLVAELAESPANSVDGIAREVHSKLILQKLPDSQAWNLLGMMSLRTIRLNNVRCFNPLHSA